MAILKRAGKAVFGEAEKIGEKVRHGKVVGSDETHARVHGLNWWQWVFVSGNYEYHLMMPSRGYDVIETFMRESRSGSLGVRLLEAAVERTCENVSDLYGASNPQLARFD